MKKCLVFFLLSLYAQSLWASTFSLSSTDQSVEAQKLVTLVDSLFPQKMKEVIDAKILIKFKDLNGRVVGSLNEACDQKLVLGRVVHLLTGQTEATIELDRVLLDGVKNIRAIKCSHKDTLTYAKAIALHELSHFYDHKMKASKDISFLNLSGWISKGIIIKKRTNLNKNFERSPDIYEYKDPAETFAVNFEFFLLDKNYQCRRPSYYAHYSNLLGISPFEDKTCEMNKKVTLTTQTLEKKPQLTKDIDASRIYQVHYLFAGKGKAMMSRWGHAMFRLVICAPGRELGPQCLQDFAHHIVVSYRANIDEMTMDYKKGMDGSYASQLFLMNMNDVVNEYTKGEFRDVISLPITMNREQINSFSNKLLENYWSYQGSYFFITNNCASEALNLLRAAFPQDRLMQTQSITTPLGLYDFLLKSKMVNANVLENTKEAIYLGYLFPGVSEKLVASLRIFTTEISFEQFALDLKSLERKSIYMQKLQTLSGKDRMSSLAHALRVEDQILISREQQFAKKVGEALFGSSASDKLKETDLDERMLEIREAFKKLSGTNFITKGYGIPLAHEFKNNGEQVAEEVLELIKRDTYKLQEVITEYFPEEMKELKGTMENRFFLLTEISKSF
jgi:hypothetical protein